MNSNDQKNENGTDIFQNPLGQMDSNNMPKEDQMGMAQSSVDSVQSNGETGQSVVNSVSDLQDASSQPSVASMQSNGEMNQPSIDSIPELEKVDKPADETNVSSAVTDIEKNAVSLDQAVPATWNLDPSQLAPTQQEVNPKTEMPKEDVTQNQETIQGQSTVVEQPQGDSQPAVDLQNNGPVVSPMPNNQNPSKSLKSRTNNTVGVVIGFIVVVGLIIGGYFVLNALGILGGNTLRCTIKDNESGTETSMTTTFDFKGDQLKSATMDGILELPDGATDEDKQAFQFAAGIMEMSFSSIEGEDGVTFDSTIKDTSYKFTLKIDADKAGSDLSATGLEVDKEATKETIKKEMEEQGFTCK